ncbi:MAG TPA: FAD/NAD(P)-binding protein [Gammaproteobacteria bacterium]|nr:FAD/NAD(P)-binding protein [Gammaproteobacteria bacterium]
MKRIVVVGGGYAGTALAIYLSRLATASLDIVLVEPRAQVGGGLAYSAVDPDHRVNAPDLIHLLYPDDDLHFRRWLEVTGRLAADPDAWSADGRLYPRRGDFGDYLAAQFAAHQQENGSGSTLTHRRTSARGIDRREEFFRVGLGDGDALEAECCVVALGQELSPARLPGASAGALGERLVDEPFAPGAFDVLSREAPVLILGTGLTSADATASLIRHGHRGPITCLSRRGLRPQQQSPPGVGRPLWERMSLQRPPFVDAHGLPGSLLALLRIVRQDARERVERGEPWHGAIDDVRDAAGEIWGALGVGGQRRFLRHLKPFYDSHRFRIPPQTQAILAGAERRGQLTFETGRLVCAAPGPDGVEVVLRPRGETRTRFRTCGAIVNCAGFTSGIEQWRNPFVRACLEKGLARPSSAGRGFEVDDGCRVVSASGEAHSDLYAIGGTTLDRFGETPAAIFTLRQVLRMLPGLVSSLAQSR